MLTSEMFSSTATSMTPPSENWSVSEACCLSTIPVKTRKHWPFLFYQQDGKMFKNKIVPRPAFVVASDVGEALL